MNHSKVSAIEFFKADFIQKTVVKNSISCTGGICH